MLAVAGKGGGVNSKSIDEVTRFAISDQPLYANLVTIKLARQVQKS